MKRRSLVVKELSRPSDSLLSGAQAPKILGRLWDDIGSQFYLDSPSGTPADRDVEEDYRIGITHCCFCSVCVLPFEIDR